MVEIHLVKTGAGIVEMPAATIGTRPWFVAAALWTRAIELCTDWRNGRPQKGITDLLVPDPLFREMRARVEQFLYRKDPALVDESPSTRSEMAPVIASLNKLDWHKMEHLGVVKPGDEPESLIDMLTNHPEETLVKMRALLEQMVTHAVTALCSGNTEALSPRKDLFEQIKYLEQTKAVKTAIIQSMHAIRLAGNAKAHNKLDIEDPRNYILATALHFVQVVEWFITSCTR